MRTGPIFACLAVLLFSCHNDTVRGPKEWQDIAQKELTESLRTRYDTVFEDAGFIKASFNGRMDVYDVVNNRVERFFRFEQGVAQGIEYEWTSDGALWFVSNHVNGKLEGAAIEFDHGSGQQYIREYRNGNLISIDSVPLTERPRITLFAPPTISTLAN